MNEIIQNRLASYNAINDVEVENATKEIIQEIALYGLWRAKFFEVAVFQGGTSLRILHKLPRFSEYLDFMLLKPDPKFDWAPFLKILKETFEEYGLQPQAISKEQMDKRVRNAVIKENSIANQLDLSFGNRDSRKILKVKLEIDVEPPAHSIDAFTYLDFPVDFEVRHQDLASNFALKIHALLCREYIKGRDWYDFSWYVAQGTFPILPHLQAALRQFGPWTDDETLAVNVEWLQTEMTKRIQSIDWDEARKDVNRFLRPTEAESLNLWGSRFFESKLNRLVNMLPS
ncbi:MAG: nucleotidyl transferase AbiEii/AbiGii toxin family protein [Marinicaulis sp.]|nr:nucleotidyl transferase AbiEii/AbiGii toxin family protein [Marinicaulis sp.]NNL89951.1 nucleotidyl transferase AbiEii/AbiGii toxin family protein [Marinicaulis sp.]